MDLYLQSACCILCPLLSFSHSCLISSYFIEQDAKIFSGELPGIPLNLKVLGIGDGIVVRLHGRIQ